ncbi:MAG TPA: hypothetical protein VFI25_15575 [Planctomycetota bacterium]|jgi:hypothetical protein|nr:hypothetical protein [Planctomycetota bacterium]
MNALPLLAALAAPQAPKAAALPTHEEVREGIDRGLALILREQNKDGSWGGPRNKTFTDSFANPETHHAWAVATTGLVCVALLELGEEPQAASALERGLDYLVANADLDRPADWDIDNAWGFIYGLDGLSRALLSPRFAGSPKRDAMRAAGAKFLDGMARYQSPNGGWGYYADAEAAWRPEWATSFTTAAGVIALADARKAGFAVPEKVMEGSVRAVKRCRLPSGAYSYSVMAIPYSRGMEWIDEVKGSLSRIQVCNLALLRAGEAVPVEERRRGLELFFEHHRFLDVALHKPIPHEAYYFNSGYFYLFGHYYAAELIATLPAAERAAYWGRLQREILKTQEGDGGMWDFWISSHTKPYGTSFGILALGRSIEPIG